MKGLLMFLLPAVIGGGAVGAPIISAQQTSVMNYSTMQQNKPEETPGGKHKGMLEEDEAEKTMTREQKMAYYSEQKTLICADILLLQTELDALLLIDTSSFTEEELTAHNEQIATLEAQLLELQESLHSYEVRERVTMGKIAREQFKESQTKKEDHTALKQQLRTMASDRLMANYEKKITITEGLLNRFSEHITAIDAQLVELEAQLALLYEVDTTNFTEEELTAHNEQVATLEEQIVLLNEQMLDFHNQYQHLEQTMTAILERAQIRIQVMQDRIQQKYTNKINFKKFAEIE